jgi:hypothetical protein
MHTPAHSVFALAKRGIGLFEAMRVSRKFSRGSY